MKILAVSHSCVADVNQQLFVALRRLPGVELQLLMPSFWKNEYANAPVASRLLPDVDFPVHRQPIALPGNVSLHFYMRLPWSALRDYAPDVVLSAQEPWSLSGWQALRLAKKLRAAFVFQTNQNLLKKYPLPFRAIEQASYQSAAIALAYSEEARQVMLAKGRKGPSFVLPYGTDLSLFYPEPHSKSDSKLHSASASAVRSGDPQLRTTLGLNEHFVIGYMGRLVKEKGLDTLLGAFAILRRHSPDLAVKILLVGSGAEENNLRRQAAGAGLQDSVVFAGAVAHQDAGHYLRCMDAFTLPSRTMPNWKEQFGRVIIEAMACHVPVVGSDSGEIPRLIAKTGGGLVFKEGDENDLAEKLLCLLTRPEQRAQLGAAGAEAVRCHYTYEAVARRLYALLQQAVTRTPVSAAPHAFAADDLSETTEVPVLISASDTAETGTA